MDQILQSLGLMKYRPLCRYCKQNGNVVVLYIVSLSLEEHIDILLKLGEDPNLYCVRGLSGVLYLRANSFTQLRKDDIQYHIELLRK